MHARTPRSPISTPRPALFSSAVFFAILVMVAPGLRAGEGKTPEPTAFNDALPEGGHLSGRELYERFLENRYRKSIQELRVVSTDSGGSAQTTTFTIRLEDLRDENDDATGGLVARMLVHVSEPFDMHTPPT